MDALQKEIEELEKEETQVEENTEEQKEQEESTEENTEVEEGSEEEQGESEQEKSEDEIKAAQEAYRERQRKKQEEQKQRQEELTQVAHQTTESEVKLEDKVADLERIAQQQMVEQNIKQAEREFNVIEKEYKDAFPDYEQTVNDALEFTKMRLTEGGVSDVDADDYLRREKVFLAAKAVAAGKDPAEAVYNEAKQIMGFFDKFAESKGYVKPGKSKTNLQTMREMSKPNAMTGGAGKGALANKLSFDEMDDLGDIGEVTIGQMLAGEV